ncbi:MAG TPA: RNA polymerase sigma factor [Acidimicrobiia bacterium]|nr:RNA polymerase sigma factor [Acidimicrobiia bacterium]
MQQERGLGRRRDVIPESIVEPSDPLWPPDLVALYAAERTELVRAGYLICGSVAAAEDAVHDALPRVAARWPGVRQGRSYLYAAVVNAARDGARREGRAARLFATRRDAAPAPDMAASDMVALSADSMALHSALARLPVNQRTAIVLRYFLDWDDEAIAVHFGVRNATVRSRVHRGLVRMQRDWKR